MAEGDLQKAVGVYLRRYCLGMGLSQEVFVDVIGVHRNMGGLERGERNLTLKSVERIADTLGVNVLEMLRG